MRSPLSSIALAALAALAAASCESSPAAGADATVPPSDALVPPHDGAPGTPDRDGVAPGDATQPPAGDQGPPPSGCGRPAGANDRAWTLAQGDRERTFFVHVPPSYDPARPTPVVIDFHGRGSNAQQQIFVSGLLGVADSAGFIAVHPEGVGQTWNAGLCCGEAQRLNIDDVGFTRAMIDRLAAELCIDPRRVYATGLSNGGFMSHRLACELADRIAAIGPVAGTNALLACSPTRAVPVYHFHGTADTIVPYDGFAGQLAVSSTMQGWVARNGCSSASQQFFAKDEVRCEEWTGCRDDATVRLCTIEGGGHQWPGGWTIPMLGDNTSVISASQELWTFFAAHPRP